jgi:hypothetical protein
MRYFQHMPSQSSSMVVKRTRLRNPPCSEVPENAGGGDHRSGSAQLVGRARP